MSNPSTRGLSSPSPSPSLPPLLPSLSPLVSVFRLVLPFGQSRSARIQFHGLLARCAVAPSGARPPVWVVCPPLRPSLSLGRAFSLGAHLFCVPHKRSMRHCGNADCTTSKTCDECLADNNCGWCFRIPTYPRETEVRTPLHSPRLCTHHPTRLLTAISFFFAHCWLILRAHGPFAMYRLRVVCRCDIRCNTSKFPVFLAACWAFCLKHFAPWGSEWVVSKPDTRFITGRVFGQKTTEIMSGAFVPGTLHSRCSAICRGNWLPRHARHSFSSTLTHMQRFSNQTAQIPCSCSNIPRLARPTPLLRPRVVSPQGCLAGSVDGPWFGDCFDWTKHPEGCPECQRTASCGECLNSPFCGYCPSLHMCMDGTDAGPINGTCPDWVRAKASCAGLQPLLLPPPGAMTERRSTKRGPVIRFVLFFGILESTFHRSA